MNDNLNVKYYQTIVSQTKCGSYRGKTVFAKPILLLAVFDMVIDERIKENKILLNDCLINYYTTCFKRYFLSQIPTPIFKPFYYLKNDGYWHLEFSKEINEVPSFKFLRENSYASFDAAFWEILQTAENLLFFKRLVIEKFFNTDN